MSNINKMYEFFDIIDTIIIEMSEEDTEKAKLLETFFVRILSVCDGLEGPNFDWNGIALVAAENLPKDVEEINDDFLYSAWLNR